MDDVQSQFEAAVAQHQAGNLAEAEAAYRRVVESDPQHWDAVYLLGTALLQLSRFEECIEWLQRIIDVHPDSPDAHNNLGVAHKALGNWQQAGRAFETAIKANPEYDQAFYNLGALMEDRRLFSDAEKCYRHVLKLKPGDPQSQYNLANVLKAQGLWSDAEEAYRSVLALQPNNQDVRINLAFVLVQQERLTDAVNIYQQILAADPNYYEIHNNLSYIHDRQGNPEAAIASAQAALAIFDDYPDGHNNWGTALRSMHRLDEACERFQKALDLRPDFALAEFNLATTRMLSGDLKSGWSGYERRSETGEIRDAVTPPRQFDQPRWDGQPISGKRLLVHSDQGFGDTIQFVRFLEQVKQRSAAHVVFECQPQLVSLLSDNPAIDEIIADGEPLPEFDLQVSLSSLGGLLSIELDNLPAKVPYIQAGSELRPELLELLEVANSSHQNIGIVWQGNPAQARDALRSCPLDKLLALAELPNVSLFSLQTGETGLAQLKALEADAAIVDIGSHLNNFADTAAVLDRLDLLITVDTAVAHLGGAMGAEVWTLLPHTPDWRWLLDRDDSPWYPTMRLFRQPKWGDWDSVVVAVIDALKTRLGTE